MRKPNTLKILQIFTLASDFMLVTKSSLDHHCLRIFNKYLEERFCKTDSRSYQTV